MAASLHLADVVRIMATPWLARWAHGALSAVLAPVMAMFGSRGRTWYGTRPNRVIRSAQPEPAPRTGSVRAAPAAGCTDPR